ncbi:hypothetical protein IAQ61_009937 [Plenodomus lingam]|uniref:uncharacterized protein n=1 Tax=Leptosphaeria maculans TaxID=5022 RepID=UPI00332361C3|nr:hypothetical protein IAQ61_009937 [Plenodomus lingam]
MVKADPTRNYYADLKVSANASENEIRKAFRTLALQYHPDRNPGREADFVVKFQEIQAAHEILCDATQRAKYDAERRKHRNLYMSSNTPNTPRTRPPPPSRSAYTTTTPSGSYYRAPPPQPSPQTQRPPPPQHHNTYTTGADRFTSKNFRPPPTAQRPADTRAKDAEARANVFTAWQKMKQPRGEEPRQYSPSAQHNTPQPPHNNPNGTPFGRSQSTRVPSSRSGFDPSTPGVDEGQARSAYRNYTRAAPTPPTSTTPPSETPPTKDTQSGDAPYAEANRVRTPYYSHVSGERTSMFEPLGRSASVRNSPTHSHRPSPSHDAGAFSDSGRRTQRNSYAGHSTKPFPQMYPDSSDDESESEVLRGGNKHRGPPPQSAKPPPPPTWAPSGFSTPDHGRQANGTARHMPNSFKSRSEESINMKFSPSDWHGKFEGSADYFAPHMQKGSGNKGRTSPSRGRPGQRNASERPTATTASTRPPPASTFSQSTAQPQSYPIPPPPPGPPPNVNFPPGATFSQQAWAQTFQDPHWVFNDKKETSPRRASEAKARSKAGRKASVPQTGTKPQGQAEASRPKYQAFAEEPTTGEPDAMDIDPPAMPKPARRATRTAPSSPRLDTTAAHLPTSNGSATAPSSATTAKPPGQGLNGIGDLADPLLAPRDGGIGLDDIKDALPFDSQPSHLHPTKPNTAQPLRYPEVPFPPPPPTKIEQRTADEYFNRMEAYVKAYKRYSKTLTDHFNARNLELEDLDDHFIHHRGETTRKLGFASYLSRMKEDEAVMATWQTAQSSHIQALLQCETVRNKAIKMYQTLHVS